MVEIHLCSGIGDRSFLLGKGGEDCTVGAGVQLVKVAIEFSVGKRGGDDQAPILNNTVEPDQPVPGAEQNQHDPGDNPPVTV